MKVHKILSVCTKVIDKEASEGAGIDIIVNPNPKEISRNKKNIFRRIAKARKTYRLEEQYWV